MLALVLGAAAAHGGNFAALQPADTNAGYLARLLANEVWVFLENQNLFMQFSSDSDIEAPALWSAQELRVRTIDAARNTLVSLEEMPGSNVFATRDQVGRLLYNCIILGKRILVVNSDDPDEPALLREYVHVSPAGSEE